MDNMEKERVASLEAKMDYLIKAVDNLTSSLTDNYVPRKEIEIRFQDIQKELMEAKQDITSIKTAPTKWLTTSISICSTIIAVLAFIFK